MRLLIALAVACFWTIRAAAGEAAHSCSWTLGTAADLDQASSTHFVTADRVGEAGESDGATFRAMKPDQYQIIWTMPAFDIAAEYGAIAHVFYLTVRYRDIASTPMSRWAGHGGEGFYGKVIIGRIGGSGDGAWKEETLVIPRSMLRSGDGKVFTFALTDLKAAVPIASIVLFSADSALPDRDQRIAAAQALQRTKRVSALALAASKIHDLGLPDPGPGSVAAPTAEESKRGWRVFFPSISRQLFANSQPRPEEAACVVRACPGETRSVVIAVSPVKDLGPITVACSDLTTAGGAVAWSREPVRWARYSLQKVGSSWSEDYRECPEHLSLAVPEGVPGRLAIACVEVRVPSGLKAGTYSGTVTVTAADASQSIPVSLEIYPFGLLHPDHATHGIFYYCDYADVSPYDLLDMRDHGIDMLVAGLLPKMSAGTDHTVAIDATQVRATFAMLKRMG
ncbi:MAG: hypothetical protein H0W83_17510, partial [Planctomycetes bacterium]|nr:hypothetical protein [Planctomycetota bacterium]